jgi:integrase
MIMTPLNCLGVTVLQRRSKTIAHQHLCDTFLTDNPMHRVDAYRMIQHRATAMGLQGRINCHTFRATGITVYLEAGGTLENAQAMAAHESPKTTKLYDRTGDAITLDEVERIKI